MAFRIAISGLNAATAALDVAGNNIANSATTGFKSGRAQFSDVFATSNLGITNDAIGQGVKLSAVNQSFTQGNIAFTNNSMDLALNGQGFFTLEDTAGTRTYSRAGEFGVDKDGFIVNATGQRLVGFQANAGAITGALGALQLSTADIAPQATTQMGVGVNLDSTASIPTAAFDPTVNTSFNHQFSTSVFDSLGADHLATMFFRRTGLTTWDSHLRIDGDNAQTTAVQTLTFDNNGQLTTAMPVNYGAFTAPNGSAPFTISVDLSNTTQLAAFGVNSLTQDGFTSGRLNGIDFDENGVVLARFTNGQAQAQGQLALANFANPQGLQPLGDTMWAETNGSGPALVGAANTASLGLVQDGALEESNADIAEQLVNVIIAQRNFQANAQVIQAEDQITQTVINIR